MSRVSLSILSAALLGALSLSAPAIAAESAVATSIADHTTVHHRTVQVDGLDIFYREAGPAGAPVVVLLHGYPSSSHMFRNLIPRLASEYRVIAPDYPGFGHSEMPARSDFDYSFKQLADIMDKFVDQLGVQSFAIYVMDYGAPVGFRIALENPDKVSALIIQNGNAYDEGLKEFWDPLKRLWASGSRKDREAMRHVTTLEITKFQYLDGVKDPTRIDPSAWLHDQTLLDRPGNADIQLDLFYDYRTNVELYPQFQQYFRERQPPALIVWGANDQIFPAEGARAYLRDLKKAELHLLDTGHFALEDKGAEITALMLDFLKRNVKR